MPYDSLQVANAFLELADSDSAKLTNMQLQKLVYFAQGFSLALEERPLTYHNIHAWQWGPVLPKVYKEFEEFKGSPIDRKAVTVSPPVPPDSNEASIIKAVWNGYGAMTGGQLSAITHKPGSPWTLTWGAKPYSVISSERMMNYFTAGA